MTPSTHANIHPTADVDATAFVDPSSEIGEGVTIERNAVVGPNCVIGPRSRLRAGCQIVENVTMGTGNDVHPYAVIGGDPQDRGFDGTIRGVVEIGDRNVIREHVTINRSTGDGRATKLGSDNYMMTQTHIGHNAQVGSRVTMTNASSLAGHATVGDGCVLSSYVGIHQFTRVGELVMFRGNAGTSMHVPPYVLVSDINVIAGLNKVGLERNRDFTDEDRAQIKRAYRAVYRERSGRSIQRTIDELKALDLGPPARRFVDFIDESISETGRHARGIVKHR